MAAIPDTGGTVSNTGWSNTTDGTITIIIDESSTAATWPFENENCDEAQVFDNRSSSGHERDDAIDSSEDPIRITRSPCTRAHFKAIQAPMRSDQTIAPVYFYPRYRARYRQWTGKNFRRFR